MTAISGVTGKISEADRPSTVIVAVTRAAGLAPTGVQSRAFTATRSSSVGLMLQGPATRRSAKEGS